MSASAEMRLYVLFIMAMRRLRKEEGTLAIDESEEEGAGPQTRIYIVAPDGPFVIKLLTGLDGKKLEHGIQSGN